MPSSRSCASLILPADGEETQSLTSLPVPSVLKCDVGESRSEFPLDVFPVVSDLAATSARDVWRFSDMGGAILSCFDGV